MQSDRWIEKGDFRSKTKSCILTQSKRHPFDPNFFDRAIRSAHPVEKVGFLNGMRGSDCSIEKKIKPTTSLTTPENTRPHPTTAPMLAWLLLLLLPLLLTASQRGTSCSPPASSAYRHPMAAERAIDDLFSTPLLLLCSLWRLSTSSNATTATIKGMRALRAPNEHFARGKGATKTCA